MDDRTLERLTLVIGRLMPRRATLGGLSACGLAAALGWRAYESEARKNKRKKKKCARAGQKTGKQRKKCCKGLVKDAAKRCASRRCACPADHICLRDGTCQLCNMTCDSGNPVICGALLKTVLNLGETLYICPGIYQGSFVLDKPGIIIGAGGGDDPASNTILKGNGAERVLQISHDEGTVELAQLRITGGIAPYGAGIYITQPDPSVGSTTLTDCVITDNKGGVGGGIYVLTSGSTTLTDCLVEDNSASGDGGGIYIPKSYPLPTILAGSTQVRRNAANRGGGIFVGSLVTLEIAETCRITENTAAAPGNGGGIFNDQAVAVTLHGADPSPIVADNCHENCVAVGLSTVPKCSPVPPVSCPAENRSRKADRP